MNDFYEHNKRRVAHFSVAAYLTNLRVELNRRRREQSVDEQQMSDKLARAKALDLLDWTEQQLESAETFALSAISLGICDRKGPQLIPKPERSDRHA